MNVVMILHKRRAWIPGKCRPGWISPDNSPIASQVRAESSSNGASTNGSGQYDFDLFTIGAGSGGVRAARFAASTFGNAPLLHRSPIPASSNDLRWHQIIPAASFTTSLILSAGCYERVQCQSFKAHLKIRRAMQRHLNSAVGNPEHALNRAVVLSGTITNCAGIASRHGDANACARMCRHQGGDLRAAFRAQGVRHRGRRRRHLRAARLRAQEAHGVRRRICRGFQGQRRVRVRRPPFAYIQRWLGNLPM